MSHSDAPVFAPPLPARARTPTGLAVAPTPTRVTASFAVPVSAGLPMPLPDPLEAQYREYARAAAALALAASSASASPPPPERGRQPRLSGTGSASAARLSRAAPGSAASTAEALWRVKREVDAALAAATALESAAPPPPDPTAAAADAAVAVAAAVAASEVAADAAAAAGDPPSLAPPQPSSSASSSSSRAGRADLDPLPEVQRASCGNGASLLRTADDASSPPLTLSPPRLSSSSRIEEPEALRLLRQHGGISAAADELLRQRQADDPLMAAVGQPGGRPADAPADAPGRSEAGGPAVARTLEQLADDSLLSLPATGAEGDAVGREGARAGADGYFRTGPPHGDEFGYDAEEAGGAYEVEGHPEGGAGVEAEDEGHSFCSDDGAGEDDDDAEAAAAAWEDRGAEGQPVGGEGSLPTPPQADAASSGGGSPPDDLAADTAAFMSAAGRQQAVYEGMARRTQAQHGGSPELRQRAAAQRHHAEY